MRVHVYDYVPPKHQQHDDDCKKSHGNHFIITSQSQNIVDLTQNSDFHLINFKWTITCSNKNFKNHKCALPMAVYAHQGYPEKYSCSCKTIGLTSPVYELGHGGLTHFNECDHCVWQGRDAPRCVFTVSFSTPANFSNNLGEKKQNKV